MGNEDEIRQLIEKLEVLDEALAEVLAQKRKATDEIITPRIKGKLAQVDAEFESMLKNADIEKNKVEDTIRALMVQHGETIKGKRITVIWSKPRVSWDTESLDDLLDEFPELLEYRKQGKPVITIKRK